MSCCCGDGFGGASPSPSGGVESFNGRTGVVVPEGADYRGLIVPPVFPVLTVTSQTNWVAGATTVRGNWSGNSCRVWVKVQFGSIVAGPKYFNFELDVPPPPEGFGAPAYSGFAMGQLFGPVTSTIPVFGSPVVNPFPAPLTAAGFTCGLPTAANALVGGFSTLVLLVDFMAG